MLSCLIKILINKNKHSEKVIFVIKNLLLNVEALIDDVIELSLMKGCVLVPVVVKHTQL